MKKLLLLTLLVVTSTTSFAADFTVENYTFIGVNAGDNNIDALIASYDKYVDKYIATMKKVKAGDPTAMTEYAKLLKQAQDLQKKLEKVEDEMTEAQAAKFNKITLKLAKAAEEM